MTDLPSLMRLAEAWADSRDRERTWRPGDSIELLVDAQAAQRRFRDELALVLLHLNLAQAAVRTASEDAGQARRFANEVLDRDVDALLRAARAEARLATVERHLEASREAGRAALARARRAEAELQALRAGQGAAS